MKTLFALIAAFAAISSAAGQFVHLNQTAPFLLRIDSAAKPSYHDSFFWSCHVNGATRKLCIGDSNQTADTFNTFYFNHSTIMDGNGNENELGILVWNMPAINGDGEQILSSESLRMFYSPVSNVVVLILFPGGSGDVTAPIAFDEDDHLFLYAYVDDTVVPPVTERAPKRYYHWAVCQTVYIGETRTALAWVTAGKPVNPSCTAVNVTRQWI